MKKRLRVYRHKEPESAAKAQADIVKLYEAGMKPVRIAKFLHMSEENAYYYLKGAGIVLPRSREGTAALEREILRLREEGITSVQIGEKVKRDHSTVLHYLHKQGIYGKVPEKKVEKKHQGKLKYDIHREFPIFHPVGEEEIKDYAYYLRKAGISKPTHEELFYA